MESTQLISHGAGTGQSLKQFLGTDIGKIMLELARLGDPGPLVETVTQITKARIKASRLLHGLRWVGETVVNGDE